MPKIKSEIKNFVFDTNILLYDPWAIFNFQEHNVFLPVPVIHQIDCLKNDERNKDRAKRARIVAKILMDLMKKNKDKLRNPNSRAKGISLGKGKGRLYFVHFEGFEEVNRSKKVFTENTADNQIITIAYHLKERKRKVVLLTKDAEVFLMASTLGIEVDDYKHDEVKNPELISAGVKEISPDGLYDPSLAEYLNQPFIVHDGDNSSIYRWTGQDYDRITRREIGRFGIKPRNLYQDFAVDILMNPKIEVVALVGAAGSGKTLLAVACAIALHEKSRNKYKKILIGRSATELEGENVGWTPGGLQDKYKDYMAPFYEKCEYIMERLDEKEQVSPEAWAKTKGIEEMYLNVIKGRSYRNSIIIVDEVQNLTRGQIITLMTRAEEGCKIFFLGDTKQIDRPDLTPSTCGISCVIDAFCGQESFAFINMPDSERSKIAEMAYKLL